MVLIKRRKRRKYIVGFLFQIHWLWYLSLWFFICRNAFNITMCVSDSVWEIIGQADGGLSVLRTFRLLRVLKLVRFLPALRRQLVVLMKTMDNVATFCMLLMLFIFTFRCRPHPQLIQPIQTELGVQCPQDYNPDFRKQCYINSSLWVVMCWKCVVLSSA